MGDGPVEQDHLASDVVDEVLARDLVAGGAHGRTKASPRNGLRARPTCNGPVGFALVRSSRTCSSRAGDVPYVSPSERTAERTSSAKGAGSTVKLTYGPSGRSGANGETCFTREARSAIEA